MGDALARAGHPSGEREHQPAQGVHRLLAGVGEQRDREIALELVDAQARVGFHRPVGEMDQGGAFRRVVLVLDFADDLLDQVFDGDQSMGPAIFVDDHRHVDAGLAHLLQKVGDRHGFGNEEDVAPDAAHVEGSVAVPLPHDVADVDHAHDVVEIAAMDGHARVAVRLDRLHHLVERRRDFDRRDVVARDHGVLDGQRAEAEKVEQQVPLVRADPPGGVPLLLDDLAEGFAPGGAVVAAQPLAQPAADGADEGRGGAASPLAVGHVASRRRFVVVAHGSASATAGRGACLRRTG